MLILCAIYVPQVLSRSTNCSYYDRHYQLILYTKMSEDGYEINNDTRRVLQK